MLRRFDLHVGHCTRSGCRVQGRHPLQTSDATGAAASQLGPDAQAAIVHLNKHGGLSHGKIAEFFGRFFGIRLSRSGACQAMLRWHRRDADNERLAAHLDRHRDQLFTFLGMSGLDATNYRAEQAIRPAVANRKVCAGNRTVRGGAPQSVLLTGLRTAASKLAIPLPSSPAASAAATSACPTSPPARDPLNSCEAESETERQEIGDCPLYPVHHPFASKLTENGNRDVCRGHFCSFASSRDRHVSSHSFFQRDEEAFPCRPGGLPPVSNDQYNLLRLG